MDSAEFNDDNLRKLLWAIELGAWERRIDSNGEFRCMVGDEHMENVFDAARQQGFIGRIVPTSQALYLPKAYALTAKGRDFL